ncbi:hypothetical protein DNTS_033318 [Danionella cerebrum]|uniref:Protein FAM184A/B N-terminal domain-containing protein n=1 Tax=Danionella cerebrum TaxID=2873325 RepID=A0A553PUX1_9TELE|nr:hypothetical protein DNTS_033318 [Danionella translucida]
MWREVSLWSKYERASSCCGDGEAGRLQLDTCLCGARGGARDGRGRGYTAVPVTCNARHSHAPVERQVSGHWAGRQGAHAACDSCLSGWRVSDGTFLLCADRAPGATCQWTGRGLAGRCSMHGAFGFRQDSAFSQAGSCAADVLIAQRYPAGSGKMNHPSGGTGACNGSPNADMPNVNVEQEVYDYQMHTKMCKKIAQLTKVIYSLNTKNDEQESTLQSLRRVATETQGSLQPTTDEDEGEESAFILRTRLLELQATVEEIVGFVELVLGDHERVEEREQRAEIEYAERISVLSQETSDLRRDFQSLQTERESQHKLLQHVQQENMRLENECQELRGVIDDERKRQEEENVHRLQEEINREAEKRKKETEERDKVSEERARESLEKKRVEEEFEERLRTMRQEAQALSDEKERMEKELRREAEEWKTRVMQLEEDRKKEQESAKKTLQQSLNEHINQWQQREQENRKSQNATLQQRLRKTEADLEDREQRLSETNRRCCKLQERVEDLEEQLEDGRHRVAEAEHGAKKAEEELTVAKERLLLQENELQSKSACHFLPIFTKIPAAATFVSLEFIHTSLEWKPLNSSDSPLKGRCNLTVMTSKTPCWSIQNFPTLPDLSPVALSLGLAKELMSQSSSQVKVSAEVEELRSQLSRLNIRNKELELQNSGRSNDHARMLKQARSALSPTHDTLSSNNLHIHADTLSSMRLELQRAHTEEIRRLQQEVENERKNDKLELEEEKQQLQQVMEEEKGRLKEQLRKALEEVIRKHASELRLAHAMLDAEKKKIQQTQKQIAQQHIALSRSQERLLLVQKKLQRPVEFLGPGTGINTVEEQIKSTVEEKTLLETEREVLSSELQLSKTQMIELEGLVETLEKQRQEEKERAKEREKQCAAEVEKHSFCGPECERVREELENTQNTMLQIQEEYTSQKEVLQAEISALQQERDILQQTNHGLEERIRLQFEKQFSDQMVELKRERDEEMRKMNQQWQQRVEELQTQLEEWRALSEKMDEERERRYGNGEMERMKLEIQKTRDMNSSLRAQLHSTIQEKERLMRQHLQVVKEEDEEEEDVKSSAAREAEREKREDELLHVERLNHQRALQTLQTQAQEELQTERQRLLTQHKLQIVSTVTDKQKAELTQQHTEWVRQVTQRHMQQIEDLQNEIQTHTQMMALQQDLKQQNRLQSLERQLDEKSSEVQELKRENDDLKDRLSANNTHKEESDEHRHTQKSFPEVREEAVEAYAADPQRNNIETVKREHRLEIQNIISDFSSAQTRLQTRIVALETELREREERGKRRVEDLHTIAKLQDKLSERDQLIKSLVEDLHQISQHPPDEISKPYDSRTQTGTLTHTLKKKAVEETSVLNLCSYDGGSPKAKRSPVLEPNSRGTLLTRTHTPSSTANSPSPPHTEHRTAVRHGRPPSQELRHQHHPLKLNHNQHIRIPAEQRVIETGPDGQDPQKQEWFTKYFSF